MDYNNIKIFITFYFLFFFGQFFAFFISIFYCRKEESYDSPYLQCLTGLWIYSLAPASIIAMIFEIIIGFITNSLYYKPIFKDGLDILKKTNSSVEILIADFKTFRNNMDTTVRNFGINVNTIFKNFGDKIDTTFKQFSNKINVFTASQDRSNRNLLKILNNLAGQHCWK